ncbi:MAG: glycosyltransferase family 4 protein, partial [Pacificimonas sp.]
HAHRRKGIHVLLQACASLLSRGRRDFHLLILGDRPGDRDDLRTELLAIDGHYTLAGYRKDVAELVAGADIGCLPTTGWDSFPLSPLEMQASGLPVVVSNCGGLPEAVEDGRTGLVVPAGDVASLADALARLIVDAALRKDFGTSGRRRINDQFTHEAQIERLAAIMTQVTG